MTAKLRQQQHAAQSQRNTQPEGNEMNEIKDRGQFYADRTGDHLMRLLSIVSKTSLADLKRKKLGKDELIEALDGFGADTLLMADKILSSGEQAEVAEGGGDAAVIGSVVKEIGGIITKTVGARVDPIEKALISVKGDVSKVAKDFNEMSKSVKEAMGEIAKDIKDISDSSVSKKELPALIAKYAIDPSQLKAEAVKAAEDVLARLVKDMPEPANDGEGKRPTGKAAKVAAIATAAANRPRVVAVKTAKDVFGVDLKDSQGKGIPVELWNDPDCEKVNPDYVFDEENLRVALLAMTKKPCRNVFCFGETGTGKTAFWRQLSALLKRRLFRINFENGADSYNFIGGERAKDASTVYQYGTFSLGLKHPGALILLDELCFGKPGHLAALHSTLEEEGKLTITETGERIEREEGVMICAADNTNGTGDRSGRYDGLYTMNSALRRRFSFWIRFEYMDPNAEADLVARHAGVGKKAATAAVVLMNALRTAARAGNLSDSPSLPHAIAFCELAMAGKSARKAYEETIVLATSPEYSEKLQEIYAASFREKDFEQALAA